MRVVSEVPLPEWAPFEQAMPVDEPDVSISLARVLETDPPAEHRREVTASECRLLIPRVGSFHIKGGRRIVVAPAKGAPLRAIRPWLIGSAWGALCYQRGVFLIHASAVIVRGEAVLFCAPAKGGKSTIAAELTSRGYQLVSDDLCHLNIPPHGVSVVHPSVPRIKLWSDTLAILRHRTAVLQPDQFRVGKFHLVSATNCQLEPAPVHAIYLLEWGDTDIRRLAGINAFRRFLAASIYKPRLLATAEQLSQYSSQALSVLRHVPIWEFRRPRDLAQLRESVDLLTRQWPAIV